GADAPGREAEAGTPGIAEAAIDTVIDVKRVAAAQLDLHHDRAAAGHQRPTGLGPEPHTLAEMGCHRIPDCRDVVREQRRYDIRVADRKAAAGIDDLDG